MALSFIHRLNFPARLNWFRKLSRVKKALILLVVLALLIFAGTKVFGQKSTAAQYATSQVEKGTVISTVSESGNISAQAQINVTSPTTGVIEELYVKNGDTVKAGDNLFKVKALATAAQQASAYASYLSALNSYQSAQQNKQALVAQLEKDRAAVLTAQSDVDYKNGHTDNPSTRTAYTDLEKQSIDSVLTQAHEQFTADETKYGQADTAIAAANATLASASLNYQDTKDAVVTAITDGTVANLSASVGSSVTGSSNSNSSSTSNTNSSNATSTTSNSSNSNSTTVLQLGNFGQLSVVAQVNEVDITKIKVGQKVTVTLDALANQTFVGKVVSVDTVGTSSSGVVTYNVYINLLQPPTTIYPGMTASVAIETARHDDVLFVPTSAVQTATDGTSYVRVMKDGNVSEVTVTTGITSDTSTEITSGLTEGEEVVTSVTSTAAKSSSSTTSPFSGIGGFGGAGGNRTRVITR